VVLSIRIPVRLPDDRWELFLTMTMFFAFLLGLIRTRWCVAVLINLIAESSPGRAPLTLTRNL
jgi:hypothetical protein